MSCKANVYNPKNLSISCSTINTTDLKVQVVEVTCGLIKGHVTCESNNASIVFPLIVATGSDGSVHYAFGDANGNYQMLLNASLTYDVVAYCDTCFKPGFTTCCD